MATLEAHLETLADVFDAIGDLVLAEAVHQTVAGRPERAQAATRFLDRQEVPVEPDVSATPRRADSFVHRYAVAIGPPALSAAWRALAADDARSTAEPRVDSWVAQLLGEPSSWAFSARSVATGRRRRADRGRHARRPRARPAGAGRRGGDRRRRARQRARAARRAASIAGRHDAGAGVELLATTADRLGLAELMALAGAIARVLRTARPGDARTFDVPDSAAPGGVDVAELTARADGGRAAAARRRHAPSTRRSTRRPPTVGALRDAIDGVSRAGVPGAVPPVGVLHGAPGDEPRRPEAIDAAAAVAAAAHARLAQLDALGAGDAETSARRRIAIVFGETFPVLGAGRRAGRPRRASLDDRGPVDAHRRRPAGRRDVADPDVQGPPRARRAVAPARRRRGDDRRLHGDRAHRRAAARPTMAPGGRRCRSSPSDRPAGVAVATVVHTPGRARLERIGRRARRRLVDRADPRRRGDRRDRPAVRRPVEPGAAGGAARRPARRVGRSAVERRRAAVGRRAVARHGPRQGRHARRAARRRLGAARPVRAVRPRRRRPVGRPRSPWHPPLGSPRS